ncbi:hypothetical protein BJX76DRAFT_368422 [Aspergillus varians]
MGKKDKAKNPPASYDQLPLERRIKIYKYDEEECKAAIHGQRLPKTFGNEVHQLCIIRGIRYHHGFAQELRGLTPGFTRALNARDIMSGIIPTISEPDEMPYCIWHPDVPSKDTLRALVQRYPYMLYHAARACAVTGYMDLYKELDPLPEVHVAEEAGYASIQKNSKGSQEIYQNILSHPVKYAIMNDYKRTVDVDARRISPLNGDTAVCSSLEGRWKYSDPEDSYLGKKPWDSPILNYFNITEDWCIDDHDCKPPKTPDDDFPLLYAPLPTDLPLINKDSLIYVAAYMGDVDRYARLRRPEMLANELDLVLRGICHNVFFAKWWSTLVPEQPKDRSREATIRRAINARRIMSNDLSWASESTSIACLPEMFWYPAFASSLIYEKLAHIQPRMYRQCLQACIAAGYVDVWDRLLLDPPANVYEFQSPREPHEPEDPKQWRISRIVGAALWVEAESSRTPHFLTEISAAVPKKPNSDGRGYDYCTVDDMYHPVLDEYIRVDKPVHPSSGHGPYDWVKASIGDVDHAVWVVDAVGREVLEEEMKRQHLSELSIRDIYDLIKARKDRE